MGRVPTIPQVGDRVQVQDSITGEWHTGTVTQLLSSQFVYQPDGQPCIRFAFYVKGRTPWKTIKKVKSDA